MTTTAPPSIGIDVSATQSDVAVWPTGADRQSAYPAPHTAALGRVVARIQAAAPALVAIVACMRKLLILLNAMARDQQYFQAPPPTAPLPGGPQ